MESASTGLDGARQELDRLDKARVEACQATPQVPEACSSMQSLTVNVLPN